MVRKIVFKNTSNNKNQTVNISVPEITQEDLIPILTGRTTLICKYDVKISKEEILLLVRPYIKENIQSAEYVDNNNIREDLIVGDTKRFVLIEYVISDDDNEIQSTEELFREQFVGMTKNQQYSGIRVNSTNNKFLNTNYVVNNNSIIKSVCTDSRYIDSVKNYEILLSQRIENIRIQDFLNTFIVKYIDNEFGNTNSQIYNNLYIPQILESGYNLYANFFGVNNNSLTNKFWILPNEFKKNGITYEIFNSVDGINYSDPIPVFDTYINFINNALSFSVNNNILTINYDHTMFPKSALFLPEHTTVNFNSISNTFNQNDNSFDVTIINPVTLNDNINVTLNRPQNRNALSYNYQNTDFSGKSFSIKSLTSEKVVLVNDWFINNIHNLTHAKEWYGNSNRQIQITLVSPDLKFKWPLTDTENRNIDNLKNNSTNLIYNINNFQSDFGNDATFDIIKVTKDIVIVKHVTEDLTLSFNNPKLAKNGNLYFASYINNSEEEDITGSLKAYGSGNLYNINITDSEGNDKMYSSNLVYNDIFTISRNDGQGNTIVNFSFNNNFIDGLTGYYHELDPTKTIENGTGFFNETVISSKERIGSYIEKFVNIQWFSNILTNASLNSSLYETAFVYELDVNRAEPFGNAIDGTFNFYVKSLAGIDFSSFTFKNVSFENTVFTGCNFTDTIFLNCNFTGSTFEACQFTNIYSKDCSFNNYVEKISIERPLPYNHTFLNGRIINQDFSNNYNEYTTLTFRDFNGSYPDKVSILPTELQNKNIKNFIDLSSNRVDYYNLRSLIKVETGYRFDISLTQLLINGFNGFETEEDKNKFYQNNNTATNIENNVLYYPLQDSNIEQNLNTPVIFLINENPIYFSSKAINHYFNIEIDSPDNIANISYIKRNDIIPTVGSEKANILSLYFNEFQNPLASGETNRIEDPLFYNHQFQKDLFNKNAPKICGIKSALSTDFANNGNWELLKFPYNAFGNEDTMCRYDNQTLNTQNVNIYGIPTIDGPLSYHELDISFTNNILNDYPKNLDENIGSRFSSLRIRKVNPNYKYTEGSTNNSRTQYIDTGNQYIEHQVYSFFDLSYGQPVNPKDYQMIDYII